jgi:acetyl-CoA acetyltransferase
MSEDIFVLGVSMTPFGRMLERSVKGLAQQAVAEVLQDAQLERRDLQAVYFGNCMQGYMDGQQCIRGEVALLADGVGGLPIVNVENACATASTAFAEAMKFLKAGEGEVALALGVEKLCCEDRSKMLSAFDGAWDVSTAQDNLQRLEVLGAGVAAPPGTTSPKPYSRFMDVYAAMGRFNMREFGHTQRQYAAISSKNHAHSVHNPRAQFRRPFTVEEVLAAPAISYPLTLPMCSPVSDGAAAAILCTRGALKRLGRAADRTIKVLASVVRTGTGRGPTAYPAQHISTLTAKLAYERAGVGPEDIDVAEVHDATAVGEAIQMECLGFAPAGQAGVLAERGETTVGGRLPINPSGGLQSKGHPIGATGLGQIFELVCQLRGECGARQVEGARIALAENGGGFWGYEEAVCGVTVLAKA